MLAPAKKRRRNEISQLLQTDLLEFDQLKRASNSSPKHLFSESESITSLPNLSSQESSTTNMHERARPELKTREKGVVTQSAASLSDSPAVSSKNFIFFPDPEPNYRSKYKYKHSSKTSIMSTSANITPTPLSVAPERPAAFAPPSHKRRLVKRGGQDISDDENRRQLSTGKLSGGSESPGRATSRVSSAVLAPTPAFHKPSGVREAALTPHGKRLARLHSREEQAEYEVWSAGCGEGPAVPCFPLTGLPIALLRRSDVTFEAPKAFGKYKFAFTDVIACAPKNNNHENGCVSDSLRPAVYWTPPSNSRGQSLAEEAAPKVQKRAHANRGLALLFAPMQPPSAEGKLGPCASPQTLLLLLTWELTVCFLQVPQDSLLAASHGAVLWFRDSLSAGAACDLASDARLPPLSADISALPQVREFAFGPLRVMLPLELKCGGSALAPVWLCPGEASVRLLAAGGALASQFTQYLAFRLDLLPTPKAGLSSAGVVPESPAFIPPVSTAPGCPPPVVPIQLPTATRLLPADVQLASVSRVVEAASDVKRPVATKCPIQVPSFRTLLPDELKAISAEALDEEAVSGGSCSEAGEENDEDSEEDSDKDSDSSGGTASVEESSEGSEPEDVSDKAFLRRHRKLERQEASARKDKQEENCIIWAICENPSCRKWREVAESPEDAFFCGQLNSPDPNKCSKLDDWIVKCVGVDKARSLASTGVRTVERLAEDASRLEILAQAQCYLDLDSLIIHDLA